jgi:hypothetical protein
MNSFLKKNGGIDYKFPPSRKPQTKHSSISFMVGFTRIGPRALVLRWKHIERNHPSEWKLYKIILIYFLKNHKKNTIVWIVNMFFGVGSIDAKFKCLTFDAN